MKVDASSLIEQHTNRGLRWLVFGLSASLTTALLAMVAAQTSPLSEIVVVVAGIGVAFAGRSLRAAGALIQVVQPLPPRWISRLGSVTFAVGALVAAIGALLLSGSRLQSP